MIRNYVTVDVFAPAMFGGNPLAVVLDAEGLDTAQMQAIAAEFGYSETTFVLPPENPAHDAKIRIFTPRAELPFAGHPNIGTAFVLATRAPTPPARLVFEEAAGLVAVELWSGHGRVIGAELTAPRPLTEGATLSPGHAAACLGLPPQAVRGTPVVASVGIPFLFVELTGRDALAAAAADQAAHRRHLLPLGTDSLYAYVHPAASVVHARMFAPLGGIPEDPATGSATATVAALIASRRGLASLALTVHQGIEMGRPSLMQATAAQTAQGFTARVGGACVTMMHGSFVLAAAKG